MKRNVRTVVLCFVLMFLCLSISGVYAQSSGEKAGEGVRNFMQNFAGMIFGNADVSDPVTLMTYVFLGVILFMLIYFVLGNMSLFGKEKKNLNLLLSAIIVLFILTNLPENFFSAMLLPYEALGIVVLMILPSIIVLFFSVKIKSSAMARILWVFFSVYYIAFFFYHYPSENGVSFIYLVLGIIGAFMILFVGFLRKQFSEDRIEGMIEKIGLHSKMRAAKIEAEEL